MAYLEEQGEMDQAQYNIFTADSTGDSYTVNERELELFLDTT